VLNEAVEHGEIKSIDIDLMAGILISSIQSIHGIRDEWTTRSKNEMAREVIEAICLRSSALTKQRFSFFALQPT
jgi:hypothetical protein